MPIYVHAGGSVIEVGAFAPGAPIDIFPVQRGGSVKIAVDLGLEPPHTGTVWKGAKLVPFVRSSELRDCGQGSRRSTP